MNRFYLIFWGLTKTPFGDKLFNNMTRKKRVLAIDEDAKTLHLIKKTLEQEKFEVIEALSAEDALEVLEREEVSLTICAVHMSGMSGTEFVNELHSWDLTIPVILINNDGKEKEWLDALHADASAYLTKPLRPASLIKAVHKALQEKSEPLAL